MKKLKILYIKFPKIILFIYSFYKNVRNNNYKHNLNFALLFINFLS